MSKTHTPRIYNIPAGVPFAEALAKGLLAEAGGKSEILSTYLVLLPTRRACRSLREAFLRLSDKPLLLPRMQSIGDIDEEELFLSLRGQDELNLRPTLSPMRRQILLSRLIGRLPDYTRGPEQDMALAAALGNLMDRVYTEGLDLSALPDLVREEELSEKWQITVEFLSILSTAWPEELEKLGVMEAAQRRNQLIETLSGHWQQNPPTHKVIAAGTTGSIPATANLLATIATLPEGAIVLPGLDTEMDEESWAEIEEGHPQATLKQLLNKLNIERADVRSDWPELQTVPENIAIRRKLATELMRPADTAEQWQSLHLDAKAATANVGRYEADTPQEEALLIAMLLREALVDKTKTAAVITADRRLARRVAMACRRWGIEIDDSGGQSLRDTPAGSFLRLCVQTCAEDLRPVPLMASLKHRLCQIEAAKARRFEEDLLHGPKPAPGIEGLISRFEERQAEAEEYDRRPPSEETRTFIDNLNAILSPFIKLQAQGRQTFTTWLRAHIELAERLADPATLWAQEDGEAASLFLGELLEQAHDMGDVSLADYMAILDQLMRPVTVRPAYGTHPRVVILGQLEARLVQADRVILAGLNEGSWPPEPQTDPWMSRPMRKDFGLPPPERSIGLAAHDFAQGFCAKEVFLTRARRVEGSPTVPARWLQRLDTVLKAVDFEPEILIDSRYAGWLGALHETGDRIEITRPEPRPEPDLRPERLSVTRIEKWLQDPYSIYGEYILKLKALDAMEKPPGAAEKGTLLHSVLERFTAEYPDDLPEEAEDRLINIAAEELEKRSDDPAIWSFWQPRMLRIADWLITKEREWRQDARILGKEVKGEIERKKPSGKAFTLSAKADRIDALSSGGGAIIDYKSGGTYSQSGMTNGKQPQLPLEALILKEGGFKDIESRETEAMAYWVLKGGREAGKETKLAGPKVQTAVENAESGLQALIDLFDDKDTPYYSIPNLDHAPRFNDYEHLARVKEWAALDEAAEDAA